MAGTELFIAGRFASAIITTVLDKAIHLLKTQYNFEKRTRKLIKAVTATLRTMKATATEVEKRPIINNPDLSQWLRSLKEAAYKAEDVLDDFEAKYIKKKVEGKINQVLNSASSSFKGIFVLENDEKELKEVVEKLTQLSEENKCFIDLVTMNQNNESNSEKGQEQETTTSEPSADGFIGREREIDLILEMMMLDEGESSTKKAEQIYNGLIIIPIVGIAGIGKTALAQAVYNHPDVQQAFQTKAWGYVSSNNSSAEKVMRGIIQCLDPNGKYGEPPIDNLQRLSEMLGVISRLKRYLIVLDNVIKEDGTWENLHDTLSRGFPRSVVLITTQNKVFANDVIYLNRIALSELESGQFWVLFKHFAFQNLEMSREKRNDLEKIGKEIAEKLHGLPFAAKIIGKLLRSNNNNVNSWMKISRSEWWDEPKLKSRILPSVAINYENLDPHQRQCFAYCSLFPRHSLLDKDRLVQMWMAHNFIPHDSSGARLEDIGRQWFNNLVEMSFFQPTWDNKSYIMPNLMHDLAVIVSSDECFYLSDESSAKIPPTLRHIAVDTKNLKSVEKIKLCKHLRSFLFFGFSVKGMYETIEEVLSKSKSLRVLDLSYLDMEKSPPPSIQSSTHLRFLDLSYTGIKVLTHNCSFNHYHLQALHLRGCKLHNWPTEINKLINLRHLNADVDTIAQISGIGRLSNLQELNEYRIGIAEGHSIAELKNMREITGCLQIKNCERIKSKNEAMKANLNEKEHLDSIELFWKYGIQSDIDMEILESLKPGDNIKEISITNYPGSSFPDLWITNCHFPNLRNLHLLLCKKIETLPPLDKFVPCLSSLSIEWNELLTEVPLDCLRASLKTLKIYGTPLRSLGSYPNSTTCLTYLEITRVKVQIIMRIQNLRSLKTLMFEGCPELSIEGDLQWLTYLKRLKVIKCPQFLMNGMEDIMSKPKGKDLEIHKGEGMQSLCHLKMDQTLWEFCVILGRLPSLRVLILGDGHPSQIAQHQILWFRELTTLRELNFLCCRLEHLPSNLVTLSSLQEMKLDGCSFLESLPEDGMPPNLLKLTLNECGPCFLQRCIPFVGEDWQNISHIPLIEIDHTTIYKLTSDEGEVWKLKLYHGEWQTLDEGNVRDLWAREFPHLFAHMQ